MKILLARECGGHPFWQRNKYDFELIDTDAGAIKELKFYNIFERKDENWLCGEVEFYIREDGVYARLFNCSSGSGKTPNGDKFLILGREEYDKVIILPNHEKREAERNYCGNWQDNSDFSR